MFKFNAKKSILSGALIIGGASFVSRILGLVRDRIFAAEFGASNLLDAYYAAFRIPDFVFNLLVLGALSSAFVPIFVYYFNKKKEDAWQIANSVLNLTSLFLVIISTVLFFLVPYIMFLVAPGFSGELKDLTAKLTRIMLISPIFFGISNIFSGVLNSFKKFLAYSLAPVFYNLGIIFGAIFLVPHYDIYGLAWGVAIGSGLHMLVQLPAFLHTGFKYRPIVNLKHSGVRRIGKLMIPRTMGLAMTQINLWVITVIASLESEGSISIFNLANNLQSFPVGIFGVAFSISCFPYLAEAFSKNDQVSFRNHFSSTFTKVLFFIIPASMLLLIERAQIVRLVLGAGNFDWEDTYLTAQSLGFFAIGVFAQALIPLVARAFYSIQDTRTPVVISIISVIVNIVASLILVRSLGVMGLALAFSVAAFVNILLLLITLRWKIGDLNDNEILTSSIKILILSLIMGGVAYMALNIIAPIVDMKTFWGVFVQAALAAAAGIFIYFGLAYLLRLKELKGVWEVLRVKKSKTR